MFNLLSFLIFPHLLITFYLNNHLWRWCAKLVLSHVSFGATESINFNKKLCLSNKSMGLMQQKSIWGSFYYFFFFTGARQNRLWTNFAVSGQSWRDFWLLDIREPLRVGGKGSTRPQFRDDFSLHLYSALSAESSQELRITLVYRRRIFTLPAAAEQDIRRSEVVVTLSVTFMVREL